MELKSLTKAAFAQIWRVGVYETLLLVVKLIKREAIILSMIPQKLLDNGWLVSL